MKKKIIALVLLVALTMAVFAQVNTKTNAKEKESESTYGISYEVPLAGFAFYEGTDVEHTGN